MNFLIESYERVHFSKFVDYSFPFYWNISSFKAFSKDFGYISKTAIIFKHITLAISLKRSSLTSVFGRRKSDLCSKLFPETTFSTTEYIYLFARKESNIKEEGYYDVKKWDFFNFMRSKQHIKILTVSEYKQVLREADIVRCSLNIVVVKVWKYIQRFNLKKKEIEKLFKSIFQENWHIFRITYVKKHHLYGYFR